MDAAKISRHRQRQRAISEPTASLEDVLRLAARGWRIHPCKARDKVPFLTNWQDKATCDPSIIEQWSITYRDCNWAVKTGADSGIWVLDCDGEKGANSLSEMTGSHGDLWLKTLTAITSNGQHSYFENPPDIRIRNSVEKLRPGLDVRGDGGYVIAPPSLHPSGRRYRWANPDAAVLPTPEWLLHLLASPTSKQSNTIGKLYETQRNDGLARLAGAERRRGMTHDELSVFLLDANSRRCVPPLGENEVLAIAASVSRYPVGGPDPLEAAWEVTNAGVYKSTYERFVALFNQLQSQRPGLPIALPLERIASLFGCDWSLIRRYRQRAVEERRLELVQPYIPHKRAATYRASVPLRSTTSTTSGLVVHPLISPSGTRVVRQQKRFMRAIAGDDDFRSSVAVLRFSVGGRDGIRAKNKTAPRCELARRKCR
ncbi:bifunctional DNA primase/polymerase [Edaphobacter aggregans]|uniref:bifunctional DNA primase/polymerase n=1 Tax=Edaphobacter aggregans TaxID=570835 RepID=UPI000A077161|nr:bifunctional DNA primase/polymerase [Edaphobacter aggregans]